MLLSKTLSLFLDGVGRREEYEYYLKAFQAEEGTCFAALAPDLASMEQSTDLMVFDLHFLLKVELVPLLLLCGPDASAMAHHLVEHAEVLHLQRAVPSMSMRDAARAAIDKAKTMGKVPALVAPDASPRDAVLELAPNFFHRLHVLRVQGGLRDPEGQLIWYHWLKGTNRQKTMDEDGLLLATAADCLAECPSLHFSVASPLNLLEELFTVRGAGTIIRRGSRLVRATALREVDVAQLKGLLEDAFHRPLMQTDFLGNVSDFYVEEDYRGAALLEPHASGKYLSKFAVGLRARGEGLALELWNAMASDHPALFWRSRVGNPINTWYGRQADGRHREGDWQIYWRGARPADLPAMIDYAVSRPSDFGIRTEP